MSILNGKVSSNLTAHGTEISMSCNGGYSLLGAETMTCSNGSWTEAVPECYKGNAYLVKSHKHFFGSVYFNDYAKKEANPCLAKIGDGL